LPNVQTDNKELDDQLRRAQTEIESLKQDIIAKSSEHSDEAELAELRFHKDAVDKQMRKISYQCQRLEDERAQIISVLKASKMDAIDMNDISTCIVRLCDKVASFEESNHASSSQNLQIDKLKKQNKSLEQQVSELRSANGQVIRAESALREELASLRQEETRLKQLLDDARRSAELDSNNKVRYLEKENLKLMTDLKNKSKQLQTASARIKVLEMREIDNDTAKANAMVTSSSSDSRREVEKSTPLTPYNKENVTNKSYDTVTNSSKRQQHSGAEIRNRSVPGLGESSGKVNDDNTQECRQS